MSGLLGRFGYLDHHPLAERKLQRSGNRRCLYRCGTAGRLEGNGGESAESGASKLYVIDCREELVKDFIFPMLRAGAIYEGKYLLGTSIARPLQAKHQVQVALKEGCDAVAHGCTGKGNDQVRFELTYKALAPHLKVIAPWRIWDIHSREQAIEYAKEHNVPLGNINKKNIYSRDWNIWHMSHEGGVLEDPWQRPEEDMFILSKSPKECARSGNGNRRRFRKRNAGRDERRETLSRGAS